MFPRLLGSKVSVATVVTLVQLFGWIGISNTFTSAAIAAPAKSSKVSFRYVPPQRGVPRTTQGTGSRGCAQSSPVALTLLIPNDHTAQTISGHPTFFWQVSEVPSEPVEFALVESGVAEPVYVKQIQLQKAGIVSLKMPETSPELVPGKEYRWSVSLVCNANRRSSDVFAQGWIRRVAQSPELEQQLASLTSDDQNSVELLRRQASIYANAGLWYDAIGTLLTAQTTDTPSSIDQDLQNLFSQAGLAQLAGQ